MESLLKQVPLTQDVVRVLDEIRAGAENALYGAGSDESEELFTKHVVSLVEGAGLPVLQTMHYRWFLRELSSLWRTRKDRDLAFHLELCIRKWVGLGLEPKTLQFLVCEAHERLKGKDITTKSQRHEGDGESGALDCGSAAPAFPARTDGPERRQPCCRTPQSFAHRQRHHLWNLRNLRMSAPTLESLNPRPLDPYHETDGQTQHHLRRMRGQEIREHNPAGLIALPG